VEAIPEPKEVSMDVKSYCSSVGTELTAWKANLYDVIRKTHSLPAADRDKVAPLLDNLHAVVDDLDERIERLARECPADWRAQQTAIEERLAKVKDGWKDVWGALGEPEYGIGGA
jgi:hypothetical protein